MNAVVDLQGFKGENNEFIVKEVAALIHKYFNVHFIIKPPYRINYLPSELQRQARWLTKNYHGIAWEDGWSTFEDAIKIVSNALQNKTVYVKGEEKKQWLEKFLQKKPFAIYNLDDLGYPTLQRLKNCYATPRCLSHSGHCALQNVYLLQYHGNAKGLF